MAVSKEGYLVTKNGLFKMVHKDSKRTKEWRAEDPRLSNISAGTSSKHLQVLSTKGSGDFVVEVDQSEGQWFEVEASEGAVYISSVSPDNATYAHIAEGDRVISIDGYNLYSDEDWHAFIKGKRTFDMVVRPAAKLKDVAPDEVQRVHSFFADGRGAHVQCCIVFNALELCKLETDGVVQAPLKRYGDLSQRIVWPWSASNVSIPSALWDDVDDKFKHGEVVFEAGSQYADIDIMIPNDRSWHVETMFTVHLDQPLDSSFCKQNGVHVFTSDYLSLNVYCINVTSFPAGAFGSLLNLETEEDVESWVLMKKFLSRHFNEFRQESRVAIGYVFAPPIIAYLSQLNFGILVNCSLSVDTQGSCQLAGVDFGWVTDDQFLREGPFMLFVFVIIKLCLMFAEHLVQIRVRMLRLGGKARKSLRTSLFVTLLQMSESARSSFDDGDVSKVMDTQVSDAVSAVWLQTFTLIQRCVSFAVNTLLSMQILAAKVGPLTTVACLAAFAVLIGLSVLVFRVRRKAQLELQDEALDWETHWSALTRLSESCNRAIIAYRRGWYFKDLFAKCHADSNAASYAAKAYSDMTSWLFRYMFFACLAGACIWVGMEVKRGAIGVGDFLVLLQTIESLCKDCIDIVNSNITMLAGVASVRQIARALNMETKRLERVRYGDGSPKGDRLALQEVRYTYPVTQLGQDVSLRPTSLELPIGALTCFPPVSGIGGHAKHCMSWNTLFNVLAGNLLPTDGKLDIPARWRRIYVPPVPLLFNGTLMFNVLFSDEADSRDHAWQLCENMGMSKELLGKDDFDVGSNGEYLKHSDRVIVSIVRALMHNVDLLLVSSAIDVLGENKAIKVLRVLRSYVQGKSCLPRRVQHRKTVLYVSKFLTLQDHADYCVRLCDEETLCLEPDPKERFVL